MTRPVGDELSRFASRHGLGRQLRATSVVAVANQLSDDRYRAVSFRAGRLVLEVPTHAQRYLLESQKKEIVQAVNAQLGRAVVKSVVLRIAHNAEQ